MQTFKKSILYSNIKLAGNAAVPNYLFSYIFTQPTYVNSGNSKTWSDQAQKETKFDEYLYDFSGMACPIHDQYGSCCVGEVCVW